MPTTINSVLKVYDTLGNEIPIPAIQGPKGDAGTFASVTATVDGSTGAPGVEVTYDGENAAFAFTGLKGETRDVHSTGETVIGTWVDGKPIYRKSFDGTTASGEGLGVFLPNLDKCLKITGFVKGNDGNYASIPGYFGSNFISVYVMGSNKQVCAYKSANYAGCQIHFAIEYTKTTD